MTTIDDLRRAVASRRFERGVGHAIIAFAERPERSLRAVARDHGVGPADLLRGLRSIPGALALRTARNLQIKKPIEVAR